MATLDGKFTINFDDSNSVSLEFHSVDMDLRVNRNGTRVNVVRDLLEHVVDFTQLEEAF